MVIFIHGTASLRIASGSTNVHWVSRGFVVLAADYPGLGLQAQHRCRESRLPAGPRRHDAHRVCGIDTAVIIGLPALFDCGTIDRVAGIEVVNYASTASLEETLRCRDHAASFASLRSKLPQVGDFVEEL